ncbi:MAG: Response regulator UvrY [Spirochaetes bacterium ADurb.Bin218]|jgi:DNA-binding NarL/FixJ family response regulator|nr:response regulator transcription factor [Spirochaetota bacterium]OQB00025.1 MAG: Response regulator UvrY [Spirochaetes bacterium ADurb.Bin218]HOV08239.1 response regulator transcription factor [Spirochaetota bacterium]HPX91230.1 response regulator transcription factor [Spirochaetota bacterium]HRU66730.1 response regulator transcription factor [Spirochaetota bacterium]
MRSSKKHSVLIVEDHSIVRMGLSMLISQLDDISICSEAESGEAALEFLKKEKPDLIIVDISLQDMNGLDLIKYIKKIDSEIPILVLSVFDETFYAERAFAAGAMGYIMKQEASEVIVKAIKTVLSKQLYASEIIKNRLMMKALRKQEGEDISVSSLTDRELQVFELIGQGFDTREIAEKLRLSVKTVDTYKEHIKDKLNLKNATELIQQASRWELTRQK